MGRTKQEEIRLYVWFLRYSDILAGGNHKLKIFLSLSLCVFLNGKRG